MSIEQIFILHHTHTDLGYTGNRETVCQDLVDMVDTAIDHVAAHADAAPDERFRWIYEVSWPVLEYLKRDTARQAELFEQIRRGDTELAALYVNPTDLFDRRAFEVSTDYACELASAHNLPLTTAMFCDVPGIAWSIVDVLASRGIRYLSAAPNFIMSKPLEVERPFYWEGPDGGRLLTWFTDWRNVCYGEGFSTFGMHGDPAAATEKLFDYIHQLKQEGYRWKGLAIHAAVDNQPPCPQLLDFVRHFNAAQDDVHVRMGTNRQFFEYMEAHHATEFPVLRGAWPDWWANGNASAAWETACSRRTKASLDRCEAVARQLELPLDQTKVGGILEDMLLFDEHTWGYRGTADTPWSIEHRLHWWEKRRFVARAGIAMHQLEADLLQGVTAPGGREILNPLDHAFAGPVALPSGEACELRSQPTDAPIPVQCVRASQTASVPGRIAWLDLPPRSRLRFAESAESTSQHTDVPFAGLESNWFHVDYDETTGAIREVRDKRSDTPLSDSAAPWSWAELIHERVRGGDRVSIYDATLGITNPDCKRPRPEFLRQAGHRGKRRSVLVRGPVFHALLTRGRVPGARFVREIRLYHGGPRMDVILRLDKQVVTRYESLYLSFPFAATSPDVLVENAGAVYRAGVEQLPGSATDWHSVGQYMAISGADRTIVVVPHDVPLIQIGDINTGKWMDRLQISNGHIYSWLMNNMWFTNFPAHQEGETTLTWSITTHSGGFDRAKAECFARSARVGVVAAGTGT
ncbi:MAG: hypothetical protein KAI66_08590 [Lentisphaeria bacterium]|nr:hypothetical protein [Lentisphaeria bacterium]